MKLYQIDRTVRLKRYNDLSVLEGARECGAGTPIKILNFTCPRGEYYVIQLIIKPEGAEYDAPVSASVISDGECTCFNVGGVDAEGRPFAKEIRVPADEFLPLFFGVDTGGREVTKGKISVNGNEVGFEIRSDGTEAVNKGDNQPEKLSRLRWLNSNLMRGNKAAGAYPPVTGGPNGCDFLGRKLYFTEKGLPSQAESYFDEALQLAKKAQKRLLSSPFEFNVEGETFAFSPAVYAQEGDNARLGLSGRSENLDMRLSCNIRYEGLLSYEITLTALRDFTAPDIRLSAAISPEASTYNNGLGKWGGYFRDIDWKWNSCHQDSLYIFDVNCGARVKWLAEDYVRPLITNAYRYHERKIPHETWDNRGAGGVRARKDENGASLCAYTGPYSMKAGEARRFLFDIHLTPFTSLDWPAQFATRYHHTGCIKPVDAFVKEVKSRGLNCIIIHHGCELHPFINYPFYTAEELRELTEKAHAEGIGVKLYYTVHGISDHAAEVYAYKALGEEIIMRSEKSVCKWKEVAEPFGEHIIRVWRQPFTEGKFAGDVDMSFYARPQSRLENYYVEGLKWLCDEIGIDGVYIDDTLLGRTGMERARKVLEKSPGRGLIDMHLWNQIDKSDAHASTINIYAEIIPFLDSFMIGEGYDFKTMRPDEILCEVTGLPYGKYSNLLSDMLSKEYENISCPFIAMLYGMVERYFGSHLWCEHMYRLWDRYDISSCKVRGYWDSRCPVKTLNKDVLASAFVGDGYAIIAVANFAETKQEVTLRIDEELLGFHPAKAELPEIETVQAASRFDLSAPHSAAPRQGFIAVISR